MNPLQQSAAGERIRVAHLVSHPIQYFAPLYRELARRPQIDLTVYFYSGLSLGKYFDKEFGQNVAWGIPLTDGYRYRLHAADRYRSIAEGFDWRPNLSVLGDLLTHRYDVIWLHGYAFLNSWLAVLIASLKGTAVLLRDDQTLLTPRLRIKTILKKLALSAVFTKAVGLPIGKHNCTYLQQHGMRRSSPVSYSVDNQTFRNRFAECRPQRAAIRKQWGIPPGHPLILFCGKLIDKKQPQILLEAFRRLRETTPCSLLFSGDGELRPMLEEFIRTKRIPDVHFAGFLDQDQIAKAYTVADMLVLPSAYFETWGLVVNEAMNFNLPIIVSDHVGCGPELVRNGENGFTFKTGDVDALVDAMKILVDSPECRERFGKRSAEIIQTFSVERVADQLIAACAVALQRSIPSDYAVKKASA